jgi:DNA-binding transcriptional LysR family regulator
MRFNKLDLNLLVALNVLLEECSITRAGIRLHLSQSATSGALARLREYFDDDLLVQVGRGMVPTPLAEGLVNPVRSVLLLIQSTIEIKPGFDPLTSTRHFRVVASDYSATVILAGCARVLSEKAPHVTLEILSPTRSAFSLLDRAEIDLLVIPAHYLAEDHSHAQLYSETYTCVIWEGNTTVGESLTLEQYMALGHVAINFGERQPSFEEWFLTSSSLTRRVEVTTDSFTMMPQFVLGTNRVATMHSRLARELARYYPLRLMAPPMDIPKLPMSMQWHKALENDLAHLWLRAQLMELTRPESTAWRGATDESQY